MTLDPASRGEAELCFQNRREHHWLRDYEGRWAGLALGWLEFSQGQQGQHPGGNYIRTPDPASVVTRHKGEGQSDL